MIYQHIAGLIQQAIESELIEKEDSIYVRNQVINLLHLDSFPKEVETSTVDTIPNILENIITYAVEHNIIQDIFDEKEILTANIMNCFIDRPSVINQKFNEKYKQSPVEATDYFYDLSKSSNYIQMNRIAKNISFKVKSPYGDMDITINLSKPEKDPKQIKLEQAMKRDVNYPTCLLCKENEGYAGRIGHPARANHRIIKIPLLGENWHLQYSPYVYYNEHSILLSEEHRDMKIDWDTFKRLLTFTEKFPHYFIGSNSDLPIVGGSILSHDHYQAGRYEFTMTKAEDAFAFELNKFPEIDASILKWPISVIRLKGDQIDRLVTAADYILNTWRHYSDPSAHIRAFTETTPHNTITPIARYRNGRFELDLALRNNRTSDEHPLGIFHPHEDVHHIKKENIGLIEVMGLAVLPARLKDELTEIQKYLLGEPSNVADYHHEWAEQLLSKYRNITDTMQAGKIIQDELGSKFVKVLEDAGVFKERAAFERFIATLNK
ncbi:UDP-glucose--hexose-1-phosphate uridylyltransferase [Oceanobacillus salinisoli]|uniref:UDP-glucose--hexose-1-phosphate uridylyltransferase n=1 Tax=Oceanobacillus salinisoli TaxID=2678611 RepID=UPI0012E2475A|nr:UDP-glucose--hexose-1-phosphate uridylyltransferase [Oceanobacillus salinisoli]